MRSVLVVSFACLMLASQALAQPVTQPAAQAGPAGSRGRGGPRGNGNDAFYKLGPDSLAQEGVPHGKLIGPSTLPTTAYEGPVPVTTTQGQNGIWAWDESGGSKVPLIVGGRGGMSLTRLSAESPTPMKYAHDYSVYVPAQYDPSKPAALMVWNDGQPMMNPNGDIRAMNVVDNLIWRREMPVTIVVFLDPGRPLGVPQLDHIRGDWGDSNTLRPWEYQWLDGRYSKVVCDELLPELMKTYNIDPNPDMHAIAGASSGGISAFTVAWDRPDKFRKVISIVGTFVRVRGGEGRTYPDRVLAAKLKIASSTAVCSP